MLVYLNVYHVLQKNYVIKGINLVSRDVLRAGGIFHSGVEVGWPASPAWLVRGGAFSTCCVLHAACCLPPCCRPPATPQPPATALQVCGLEWAFGATETRRCGIFCNTPKARPPRTRPARGSTTWS